MKVVWAMYLPLFAVALPSQAVEILASDYAATLAYDLREQNPHYSSDTTENFSEQEPSISNCFHQTKSTPMSIVTNSLCSTGNLTNNHFALVTDAGVHLESRSTNTASISSAYTGYLNVEIAVTQRTYATLSLELDQSHSGGMYSDLHRDLHIQGGAVDFRLTIDGNSSTHINTTIELTNGQYTVSYYVRGGTVLEEVGIATIRDRSRLDIRFHSPPTIQVFIHPTTVAVSAFDLPVSGSLTVESTTNVTNSVWDTMSTVSTTDTVVNLVLPLLFDSDRRFYRARYFDPF